LFFTTRAPSVTKSHKEEKKTVEAQEAQRREAEKRSGEEGGREEAKKMFCLAPSLAMASRVEALK
jgi:hypothetical protein